MKRNIIALMLIIFTSNPTFVWAKTTKSKGVSSIPLMDIKLTVLKLMQEYVSPKRINPSKMFYSAMKSVSSNFPEIMASKNNGIIKIQVGNNTYTMKSKINSPWEMIHRFTRVFKFFSKNLPKDIKINKVEYAAISGMLQTLDPHTAFMPPDLYSDLRIHTSGHFGGLGIVVSVCSGMLSVVKTMPGTPAFRSGLKSGDQILEIDSQPTSNLSLTEAVSKMRGEPGESITIKIKRKTWKRPHKITIVREVISVDSVSHKILKTKFGKVGYIKIRSFQVPTANQVKQAIKDIKKAKAKGIILDLRGNGGGLLTAAINIINFFLDSGVVVAQVTENSRSRSEYRANSLETIYKKPLIILVDDGSASASEIVSGTLKYSGRALVIGRRSFGKGTVQNVVAFPDGGGLRVTIAQYLTYGDTSIQGYGILPDIEIHQVRIDPSQKGRPIIFYTKGYKETHESSFKAVLSAARKPRRNKAFYTVYALEAKPKISPFKCKYCGMDQDDYRGYKGYSDKYIYDPHIDLAKKIIIRLAGRFVSRLSALSKIRKVVTSFEKQSEKQISIQLKKLMKVDWSKGKNSDMKLKIKLQPSIKNKNGSWIKVKVFIKNIGKTNIYRLRGVLKSSNPRLDFQEIIIGKLKKGKTFNYTIRVKIPRGVSSRTDYIKIKMFTDKKPLKITSQALVSIENNDSPRIFVYRKFRDTVGNDGVLSKNEIGYFDVEVKNVGKQSTGESYIILKNSTGNGLKLFVTKYNISNLKPGKSKKLTFKIKALKNRINNWKFKLLIKDCNYGNNMEFPWMIKAVAPKFIKTYNNKTVKTKEQLDVYDVPWIKERTKIGQIPQNTFISVKALVNSQYLLKDGGYVSSSKVVDTSKTSKNHKFKLHKFWNYTPPSIDLKGNKYLLTEDSMYSFAVKVYDDTGLKDAYVSVNNVSDVSSVEQKVFYKAFTKNIKSSYFSIKIKLSKGINIISVTARDNHKTSFTKNMIVLKQ